MSETRNTFESLRELVAAEMPERLPGFDKLAHRMRAHQDDELFALFEASGFAALLAGAEVRRATAELRADLLATREAPQAIAAAAKAVALDAEASRAAARDLSTHAAALREANLRNVSFLLLLAVLGAFACGLAVGWRFF